MLITIINEKRGCELEKQQGQVFEERKSGEP